jgi:hypothetical protein
LPVVPDVGSADTRDEILGAPGLYQAWKSRPVPTPDDERAQEGFREPYENADKDELDHKRSPPFNGLTYLGGDEQTWLCYKPRLASVVIPGNTKPRSAMAGAFYQQEIASTP